MALTVAGVFPYRCSDCHSRFRRYHPDRRRNVRAHVGGMPNWLRRLLWTALAVALTVVACLFMVERIASPAN